MMNAKLKLACIWRSYRSLPGWVQLWVGLVLVPANALPFLFLQTWSGRAGACAALVVVATNLPIMWFAAGMSRAMSLPHLLAWIPLEFALLARLSGMAGPPSMVEPETALAMLLIIVNGVSLGFDGLDSWRWLKGERDVPGART